MKAVSVLTTVFLCMSVVPAFAYPSNYHHMRWDTNNLKMSDIRFNPEFLILSIPVEDSKGIKFELIIQCGNNPNFYYKQLTLPGIMRMGKDQELVTMLCTQAVEIRDVYIHQLISTETCTRINLQYGIRRIPVAQYGDFARKKDRNDNGFACDF